MLRHWCRDLFLPTPAQTGIKLLNIKLGTTRKLPPNHQPPLCTPTRSSSSSSLHLTPSTQISLSSDPLRFPRYLQNFTVQAYRGLHSNSPFTFIAPSTSSLSQSPSTLLYPPTQPFPPCADQKASFLRVPELHIEFKQLSPRAHYELYVLHSCSLRSGSLVVSTFLGFQTDTIAYYRPSASYKPSTMSNSQTQTMTNGDSSSKLIDVSRSIYVTRFPPLRHFRFPACL